MAYSVSESSYTLSNEHTGVFFITAVEYFKEEYVSENVLKKLIRQNVVEEVMKKESSDQYLFRENVPSDYFILLLQGQWKS